MILKTLDSLDVYISAVRCKHATGVEMVDGARVTAGFFRTLGVRPLLGRRRRHARGTSYGRDEGALDFVSL